MIKKVVLGPDSEDLAMKGLLNNTKILIQIHSVVSHNTTLLYEYPASIKFKKLALKKFKNHQNAP